MAMDLIPLVHDRPCDFTSMILLTLMQGYDGIFETFRCKMPVLLFFQSSPLILNCPLQLKNGEVAILSIK